jgi:hypothetical protein
VIGFGFRRSRFAEQCNHPETIRGHPFACERRASSQESDMAALAARFFPKAFAKSVAEFETLVSVALFCGVGLLMSLSVLLLGKYILGEWS